MLSSFIKVQADVGHCKNYDLDKEMWWAVWKPTCE